MALWRINRGGDYQVRKGPSLISSCKLARRRQARACCPACAGLPGLPRPSPVSADLSRRCRARPGQARSASDEPQAGTAKPDSPRGTTCSGPANVGRFLVRVSRESVVRPTLSLYPPVAWDNGPRLWLLWVEARPSSCFWCAKRWAVGHSRGPIRPFCPFSGGHYPRAKPEDDAVGAPRLASRRWACPMRRSAPHGKSQAPRVMGVACGQLRSGSFDLWDR